MINLTFKKHPLLKIRIALAIVIAIFIIFIDNRSHILIKLQTYTDNIICSFYLLVNNIYCIFDNAIQIIKTKEQLILEQKLLYQKLLIQNSELILLNKLKKDNIQLHKLLNAPILNHRKKMLAEILKVQLNPFMNYILINKGIKNDVYIGQPVINDKGIVGQIIATNEFNSRVLLICDALHALPVEIMRNNMRGIVYGDNCTDYLIFKSSFGTIDIQMGDVLVSSGLGGIFPAGYPVAVVSSMKTNLNKASSSISIEVTPVVNLKNMRYLLLLWNNNLHIK